MAAVFRDLLVSGGATRQDAPHLRQFVSAGLALFAGIVVTAAPFKQREWPLPNPPKAVSQPIAQSARSLPLVTAQTLPARPLNWSLATPPLPPLPSHVFSRSLPITAFQTLPAQPTDWPLPRTVRPSPPDTPPINTAAIRTIVVTAAPFASFDWPLARTVRPLPPDTPPLNTAAIRTITVSVAPFASFNWPLANRLPPRSPYNIETSRTVSSAISAPFASFDWPMASLGGKFTSMRQLDMSLGSSTVILAPPITVVGSEYIFYAHHKGIR